MKLGLIRILMIVGGTILATSSHAADRQLTTAEKSGIAAYITRNFKDPASAQFMWGPVKNAKIYCGKVNAKNSYGGYVGFKRFIVNLEPLASGETMFKATDQKFSVGGVADDRFDQYMEKPECEKLGYLLD